MRQGVYSAPKYLYNYPPQTAKKWPQDIECIIKSNDPDRGSLYLSNVQAAENPATIKKLRIGSILSCAKGYVVSHPTHLVPFYKYVPGQDKQTFDISSHFDDCVQFIHKSLQKTNIIVHCIAGVSRSASMVIAYFMKHYNLSYKEAFAEVKAKRKIISPNDGFIKHLKNYQEKLQFSYSQVAFKSNNNFEQNDGFNRTYSAQFYSPTKKYDYGRNLDLTRSTAKNPQSGFKEDVYRNPQIPYNQFVNSPVKNVDNFRNYKSASMTNIPGDPSPKASPRFGGGNYGKSASKQLPQRKTINYTSQKPRPLSRDIIHQDKRHQSGYFDSMNSQLNMKIEAIRRKYQQQRQELMKTHNPSGVKATEKEKSIYFDRKEYNNVNSSYVQKKDYYTQGRREVFNMYDRNVDLKLNQRMSNIDQLYVPRISAGYGLGLGYYGKRYK